LEASLSFLNFLIKDYDKKILIMKDFVFGLTSNFFIFSQKIKSFIDCLGFCHNHKFFQIFKFYYFSGMDIVGQTAIVLGWGMINDQGVYADSLMGVEVSQRLIK
jgi:hypothetical protein